MKWTRKRKKRKGEYGQIYWARPFPLNVQETLTLGQIWRAKEILQGMIAASEYDPLLYEQYGVVLLQMRDSLEAGKYLFLSGQSQKEYSVPIELYLMRHGGRDWQTLVASFPKRAKNVSLEAFPESVRKELEALQLPAGRGQEGAVEIVVHPRTRLKDFISLIGCGCAAFFIAMCFMGGAVAVFLKVTEWLS